MAEGRTQQSTAPVRAPRRQYAEELAQFARRASIGVLLLTPDGAVRWANQSESDRVGLTSEDFVGKHYPDFFVSPEEGEDLLRRLFSGEAIRGGVVTLRHSNGDHVVVGIDGEAVRREDDWHALLLTRDLTAEKRSQKATEMQASMLDAVGQAVIGTDAEGRVTYWNSAAERLYGWSPQEASGRYVFDLIVPEVEQSQAREILDSVAAGNTWSGEFPLRRRDGARINVFATDTPLLDENGKLVGYVGVTADVTSLKVAERELKARQRRLEALGESLPAIVGIASQRTGFDYFNGAWYEFSGAMPDAPISWSDYIHPEDMAAVRDGFQDVLHGRMMQLEARIRRHDGVYRWFLIRAVPLAPSDGEPGTAVVTAVDITDLKNSSQQLESAKSQLETVLRGIADGVTARDAAGKLVYANDRAAGLMGFDSAVEFLAAPDAEVRARVEIEDDAGRRLEPTEMPGARARSGLPTEEVLLKFRPSGSEEERYSLVKAAPVFDARGNVEYVVDIFRDVTERVLAEREKEDLLRREREARISAERSSERVARLQAITARLAGSWTPQEAGEAVLDEVMKSLNAVSAVVVVLDSDGGIEIVGQRGYSEESLEAWRRRPMDKPRPLADALHGEVVFISSRGECEERYPEFRREVPSTNGTWAHLPLQSGTRVLGGLTFAFEAEDALGPEDREFLLAVAGQCALAIARTQLYQTERQARVQAEDAETRYKTLAEAMPQIVWTADPQGSIDYYSPQFYEFTGLSAGEGEDWSWQSLVHPDDVEDVVNRWRRSIESGEEFQTESRLRRADGSYCWVLERAVPSRDASGQTVRWLGTITDIDEQKRAQEQSGFLAEASAVLSSSMDYEETLRKVAMLAVPLLGDWCAIHMRTGKGPITRLAIHGLDPDKLAFAEKVEVADGATSTEFSYGAVFNTGRPRLWVDLDAGMLEERGLDRSRVDLLKRFDVKSVISVPVFVRGAVMASLSLWTAESGRRYAHRDLDTAVEFARHISLAVENALLFNESQQVQEELRRANETKDEFLGLMSHELRTPITTLYGGAKILRSRGRYLDDEHKEALLNDIETEAEGMHRMIEDLLVLARTGSGELVGTEPILTNHLVEKVVRGFQLHRPGRQVHVRHAPDLLPVMADNTYLEQVLRNLLSNADKYSPPGRGIEVELRNEDDSVVVAVLDQGPGIDPREAELIFTRFYRAERTARGVRGMGLGLTVCKKLIEAQGGRIWARPRPQGGTEVGFALPAFTASYDDV